MASSSKHCRCDHYVGHTCRECRDQQPDSARETAEGVVADHYCTGDTDGAYEPIWAPDGFEAFVVGAEPRDVEAIVDWLNKQHAEIARLQRELTEVQCSRCGGCWFVPTQLLGDPRFDCPHCAAEAGGEDGD